MDQRLLTPSEVAKTLGVGRGKTYQLMKTGELPVIRIGRSVRCPAQALDAWIAANTQGGDVEDTRLAG